IPKHILNRLGSEGLSFGKEGTSSGTGLGVFSAKQFLSSHGGRLDYISTVNLGTTAAVTLKKHPIPNFFITELDLRPVSSVIVIDDDTLIHKIWANRLEPTVKTKYCRTVDELKSIIPNFQEQNILFLVDYELKG